MSICMRDNKKITKRKCFHISLNFPYAKNESKQKLHIFICQISLAILNLDHFQ